MARRPRSSFTPMPTTSATSRAIATTRPTAHPAPLRRRGAPGPPASGWRAVSSVPANRARARIAFKRSPRPTIGVEWEFALVDAHTRDLSNEATAVIAEIGETPRVHKELRGHPLEVVSGICDCTGRAMEDLRETLGPARRIVRDR